MPSKATRAFTKIARLIDARKGISPKTGIMLYKCLVRPHLEFSFAAWACMRENSILTLERVQSRCLRRILGTKAHASAEAVDVIANVMPVRLRLQQMSTLEYARRAKGRKQQVKANDGGIHFHWKQVHSHVIYQTSSKVVAPKF